MLRLVAIALLMAALSPAPALSRAPHRTALADSVSDLRRAGDTEGALRLCRRYNEQYPADAVMLYNQACLENAAGRAPAAAEAFAAALEAGLDDFEYALEDPDLQGAAAAAVADLVAGEEDRLLLLSRERGFSLVHGRWSGWTELTPDRGVAPPPLDQRPRLRLRWLDKGLEMEVAAPESLLPSDTGAPMGDGAGLLVTLGAPDPRRPFVSADARSFAYGLGKGAGVGAVWVREAGRWQWVRELDPKLTTDGAGDPLLKVLIPWLAIAPLHPLTDDPLGLNVTLRGPGGRWRQSLLENPAPLSTDPRGRRLARLDCEAASLPAEAMLGRLSDSVGGAEPIIATLTVICRTPGRGELALEFTDGAGHSVLAGGVSHQGVDLVAGRNEIVRRADFSQLPSGPYSLRAELRLPSGRELAWETSVLQLAADWEDTYARRVESLAPDERLTAAHHLQAVRAAVDDHLPRRHPGAIATTLGALDTMLGAADSTGTILPAEGGFLFVYPGPGGADRQCHLALPPGRKAGVPVVPVLLAGFNGADGSAAAERILRNYSQNPDYNNGPARTATGAWPVYVLPAATGALDPVERRRELDACLDWARDYFSAGTAMIAGVDNHGVAALQAAARPGAAVTRVAVFAGGGLDPWPGADQDYVATVLDAPAGVPVTWLDFVSETMRAGQAAVIYPALVDGGGIIEEKIQVRGGLNLTQIVDRTVLWATGGE